MSIFAPADLFAAIAVAARGDADLPDGAHLRLMPSPSLGFPIAPFGVYRATPRLATPQVIWRDRAGKVLTGPTLDAAGGVLVADLLAPSSDGSIVDVAVELVSDGPFEGRIVLLDRIANRVFAQRSRPPFIVGGPRMERVRIEGRGRIALRTWRVDLQQFVEAMLRRAPDLVLSLAIDGSRAWYANGRGPHDALARVQRGAALRLQRPDRPDGPFDGLTPADDVVRLSAHTASLDKQCEQMVGDLGVAPTQQRLQTTLAYEPTARPQFVDVTIASTLLAQALDPGIGRYLGLVGTLDEQSDGSVPLAYITIGLFAYWRRALAPDGRTVTTSLGLRHPVVEEIANAYVASSGAQDVIRRIAEHYDSGPVLRQFLTGIEMRGLLAIAGAVPPADPPQLAAPLLGNATWLDGAGHASNAFRQEFLFPVTPLGSLVALGRLDAGTWTTRHHTIDLPLPANPSRRALAMSLGRTQSKPKLADVAAALGSFMRRGLVTDAPVPAVPTPATYRLALADLFGRFGAPVQFDVPAPARPRPPVPAPQPQAVLDGPDGVGGPPAAPGHIDVSVTVPSVSSLAAGSLDIAMLRMTFDGVAQPDLAIPPIAAGAAHVVTTRIDLPALQVGETRSGALTALFVDTAGATSDVAQVTVRYADRRRPAVVPTGLGLIWTSRPGPAPEVELKLTWPGEAGTRYRVYVADQKTLGLEGNSRAEAAVVAGQRDRSGTLGSRDRFRLLTEPPLDVAGGSVILSETLPRSLTTVQFLRVVPLTAQGREAEFDACGVVPVAVPTDRGPPPPRLHVAVDGATGIATITIEATGLDLVELHASEPGLFTQPPDASAMSPEFRLRRASGLVNDPVYAREVARGALRLTREDGNILFSAQVDDPVTLQPFIRYGYWAEVRMPPERRLAPGVVETPPPEGVKPVFDAQIMDMPRPFSAFSAPVTALHATPLPVPTLVDPVATVIAEGANVRAKLTAAEAPSASTKAVGSYRLRLWEQWGNTAIGSATEIELDGSALAWQGDAVTAADHPPPLTLRFQTIDPLNRESAVTTLSV